jgi:nucleotidyltransferase substrate binding protein (TIGR01987 family)
MKKDPIIQYQFIKYLRALPFIDEIWLFGSRARGDHHDRSDIDLAIVCPTATESDWLEVMRIVDQADTLLKVDCIRFDPKLLSDAFRNNIERDKRVVYMKAKELYWKDYFENLGNAIERFKDVMQHPDLGKSSYMRDAAIQRFEFTIELFWKILKKVLQYEKVETTTPRDVLSKAFQYKLIDNEAVWLRMLDDRNSTSHVYNEKDAERIFDHIKSYPPIFVKSYQGLKDRYQL